MYFRSGPDLLSARNLNELAGEAESYLTKISQKSLDAGQVSKAWRLANVTAIFKKKKKKKKKKRREISTKYIAIHQFTSLVYVVR